MYVAYIHIFDESKVVNVDPDELDIKSITELETWKLISKFS